MRVQSNNDVSQDRRCKEHRHNNDEYPHAHACSSITADRIIEWVSLWESDYGCSNQTEQ
jgi:hypothetical protein